jgi:hypothetical protein
VSSLPRDNTGYPVVKYASGDRAQNFDELNGISKFNKNAISLPSTSNLAGRSHFAQTRFWYWYFDGSNIAFVTSTVTWTAASNGISDGDNFDIFYDPNKYAYAVGTTLFYWRYGTINSGGTVSWSISRST